MLTAFFSLFDTSRFPARWLCGEWSTGLGWLHIGSDLAIWAAYFSIPALLLTLARRRRDLPFRRVFLLFGAFILLCGTTHLIEAVIFWWPIYPVAAAVKFATAVASWGTVVTLAPVVRDALTLRSPAQLEAEVAARTAELKRANERLAAEAGEHRRTLDSLHRTEERLRLALEAGEMGAWEWDLRDNRVEWTPGLDAMHGLAPGAFGGTLESFVALVHHEDRPQLKAALEVALKERGQFSTEFRTKRSDGTQGWVAGIGRAHYEPDGRPVRMVGVGLDVTARRQAEEAARFLADAGHVLGDIVDVESTLERLAALAVPRFADYCAVSLLDVNGELRRVPLDGGAMTLEAAWAGFEASYPEIVADSAENVVGTGVAEFVPVISPALLETRVADAASAETPASLGLRSYLTVPLKARGRVLGSLTFVTAGSGRHLNNADVRLAEQLAERASTAVENARLYEALREADRRKDQFLAVLAHELRNPLAPLASVADLLAQSEMTRPDRLRAGAVLGRQVGLLTRLIDDLLDVARISEGKFTLRPERTTLGSLIERALELVAPQATDAGQTIAIDLTGAESEIVVDGSRVVQAVANLLANAVKFSPQGSVIQLRGEVAQDVTTISVEDKGIGFSPERGERLFDMFAQEPGSDSHGGLGIGLYLVRAVAVLHGGTVNATSGGPGRGSVFTLRLPANAEARASGARAWEGSPTPEPRRVLIADDNRDSVEMLELLLTTHGHHVTVAFDGEQALALAAQRPHDVALLDLGMRSGMGTPSRGSWPGRPRGHRW